MKKPQKCSPRIHPPPVPVSSGWILMNDNLPPSLAAIMFLPLTIHPLSLTLTTFPSFGNFSPFFPSKIEKILCVHVNRTCVWLDVFSELFLSPSQTTVWLSLFSEFLAAIIRLFISFIGCWRLHRTSFEHAFLLNSFGNCLCIKLFIWTICAPVVGIHVTYGVLYLWATLWKYFSNLLFKSCHSLLVGIYRIPYSTRIIKCYTSLTMIFSSQINELHILDSSSSLSLCCSFQFGNEFMTFLLISLLLFCFLSNNRAWWLGSS